MAHCLSKSKLFKYIQNRCSFIQILLPCEDALLRDVTIDRPATRVGRYDSLPIDIERALLTVIQHEIAFQRRLECLKQDLEHRQDYSTLACYKSVDKFHDGAINVHNLGSFLRSCGHNSTDLALAQVIRRIDTDGDAKIGY